MKKQYIVPQAETVNIRLQNSVLDEGGYARNSFGAYGGDEEGFADAKESAGFEDESLINPTQPNLWDDDEE